MGDLPIILLVIEVLVCGLICAVIGQSKSKNRIIAFLVGAFFGPVGILIYALIPKSSTTEQNSK